MKRFFLSLMLLVLAAPLFVSQVAKADPTHWTCKDGSVQYIGTPHPQNSTEACASHGGVDETASTSTSGGSTCAGVKTSIDYGCSSSAGGPIFALIRALIKFVGGGIGLVVILMLIIGGIRYITSAGNPKLVASAKSTIYNAVIGLVLFGLMVAILNVLLPGGVIG